METSNAIRVQALIQDILTNVSQCSESLRRAGAIGTVRISAELARSSLPAPLADARNVAEEEKNQPSKISPYQEWSENVTVSVNDNTPTPFPLDEIELLHREFVARKARIDEDTAWIELYKDKLDKLSGGAESFTLDGHEVATYRRNGNLNLKRLESEQPQVVQQYTRLVTELKFDRAAFEADQPQLYAAYRAKVFRLPGARGIKTQ